MEPTDTVPGTSPTPIPPPNVSEPMALRGRARALRAYFSVYSRLRPEAAGRSAARLWCTVPAEAGRRKDNRVTHGVVEKVPMAHGGHYAVEVWGEGPTVYLMHGWGGWRGQLGAIVDPLVAKGYRVVGVDAPSHGYSDPGLWGPQHSSGAELGQSLAAVAEHYGPAAATVAHSMGSVAAMQLAAHPDMVGKLVLIAPSPDLDEFLTGFATMLGLTPRASAALHTEIERMAGGSISDFDLASAGAGLDLPPTLVIHDAEDKESPVATGRAIASSWSRAEYRETTGLGHQRILLDADVVAATVDFVGSPGPGE